MNVGTIKGKGNIIDWLKETNKDVYLTIGFRWKSPRTMDVHMVAEEAIKWLEKNAGEYALIELETGRNRLNCYTANDMW